MKLTENEKLEPLWLRIKAHFEDELLKLQQRLERDIDPTESARIRGELRRVREMLEMGVPEHKLILSDDMKDWTP